MYAVRHPRRGDPVIVFGQRGTIVEMNDGLATIHADDDIRTRKPLDRFRWDGPGGIWIVLAPEPVEPVWLEADHPADATVASEYGR